MPRTAKSKTTKTPKATTTSLRLSSVIKSARDIMRKDKGLNGELDRLPQLTWLLFLKLLDDSEKVRESEALLEGKTYKPIIKSPYRWRDWAANDEGMSGETLLNFINNEQVTLPNDKKKKKVAGLLAYLRKLQSNTGLDRQDVIRQVFEDINNRMISGALLRDVVNKVNQINFDKSEEVNILSHFYESMLKEMRDAAGDSGEFYTPRPVVRFMVKATDPKLGEAISDPACGTGGFLVEAYEYLKQQCQPNDWTVLQSSLSGVEAKPLPYMLVQMNLLLHGVEYPRVERKNSLARTINQIGVKDQVDIILTNPPFGGEEEESIKGNFPPETQTSETALLFIQLIMRSLKRSSRRSSKLSRAAIVVPNGILFGDGVCAKVKEKLLAEFNLHTVVRLPNGVFAPYTSIPTNLLFFDASGPTETIWFYELPLPEGRKNYTKTKPIQDSEFDDCLQWWGDRRENERAWKYEFKKACKQAKKESQVKGDGVYWEVFNLDKKNPNVKNDFEHLPPEQLVADIWEKEQRILEILNEIKGVLKEGEE